VTTHYTLNEPTRYIITELIATCTELGLGNVHFTYYSDEVDFYLTETRTGWDLTVSVARSKRDVYRVVDGRIGYRYSEED
jgi:hypothetical protein